MNDAEKNYLNLKNSYIDYYEELNNKDDFIKLYIYLDAINKHILLPQNDIIYNNNKVITYSEACDLCNKDLEEYNKNKKKLYTYLTFDYGILTNFKLNLYDTKNCKNKVDIYTYYDLLKKYLISNFKSNIINNISQYDPNFDYDIGQIIINKLNNLIKIKNNENQKKEKGRFPFSFKNKRL